MTSTLDLVRLLVVPFFAWAAYRDVRTRRIPNAVWGPLFAAGVVLMALTLQRTYARNAGVALELELAAIAVSVGVVAPVAYLFWLFGGFGGADAKALLVLSLLVPTYPAYDVAGVVLPLYENPLGSFAFTILTNTVVVGVLFPAALFARNALAGEFSLPMFLGERVRSEDVDEKYGTLMSTNDGMTAGSLDLDALRMYLTWRDATLEDVLREPDRLSDPDSLPPVRNDPGGGEIPAGDPEPDGGEHTPALSDSGERGDTELDSDGAGRADTQPGDDADGLGDAEREGEDDATDDRWGAQAFLDEIEGDAYGTSPQALRDGLDVLASEESVWVSPGIPFIVPMFVGLVLSFVVGDLTTAALAAL